MNNVTLRRVRATDVAVDKQCVCILQSWFCQTTITCTLYGDYMLLFMDVEPNSLNVSGSENCLKRKLLEKPSYPRNAPPTPINLPVFNAIKVSCRTGNVGLCRHLLSLHTMPSLPCASYSPASPCHYICLLLILSWLRLYSLRDRLPCIFHSMSSQELYLLY